MNYEHICTRVIMFAAAADAIQKSPVIASDASVPVGMQYARRMCGRRHAT